MKPAKDLDDNGFEKFVFCFRSLGFWGQRKFEPDKRRDPDAFSTVGQLKVIAHLWCDLAEYVPGAKHTPFQRALYKEALKIPRSARKPE